MCSTTCEMEIKLSLQCYEGEHKMVTYIFAISDLFWQYMISFWIKYYILCVYHAYFNCPMQMLFQLELYLSLYYSIYNIQYGTTVFGFSVCLTLSFTLTYHQLLSLHFFLLLILNMVYARAFKSVSLLLENRKPPRCFLHVIELVTCYI